ncbi:hypothetical protein [Falsibacillus pallidus]|uniref:hypothetical protein n=1 Tax=Falsibacillus pallidus TaxID=493781 RepID=UPI003D98E89A
MKKKLLYVLLLAFSMVTACSNSVDQVIDSPLYNGGKLVIGVVGKTPEVREKNIEFKKLTMDALKRENLSAKYDAVFIMKKYLSEASEAPYAKIYRSAGVPFFFMGSETISIPFTVEEISYDNFEHSDYYATGSYQSGEDRQGWDFAIDKINKANVQDTYTKIFTIIGHIDDQK